MTDAFQEAAIALVRAAEKYDPSRGYRFSTYASFWVRRGFSEHERRSRRMIRLPHDKAALVLRALRLMAEQQTQNGRRPSLGWLAQRCGPRNTPVQVTWTPKTEPALMRASLPARLGQEKPHETQTPQPRADHLSGDD